MANNIQHTDISLQEIKNNIEKGYYCIPKFQRNFVWRKSDIESLGDSLIRGYPISSILVMPTDGTLKIEFSSLNIDKSIVVDENSPGCYVLDGQQRITSIARIFANFDDKNQYFFDLLTILCEEFPEDNLLQTEYTKKQTVRLSEAYCRSFPISQRNSGEMTSHRQNYRFVSAKEVIEGRFAIIIAKFLPQLIYDINDVRYEKYLNYLNALFGQVGKYGIAQTRIEGTAELGVVCRVFEKVNSSGKKLTTFDLINAKSFQTKNPLYKDGLSDYLTQSLNKEKENNQSMLNAIQHFFEYDEKSEAYNNLGRIARILFITKLLKDGTTPQITNGAMLSQVADSWFDLWEQHKEVLLNCISYFYHESYHKFTPVTYLEYMLSVFCANPECFNKPYFLESIKKYALKLGIENKSFTKTDLDIVEQFHKLSKEVLLTHHLSVHKLITPSTSASINQEELREAKSTNFRFQAAYYIMLKEQHDGKFTKDISNISCNNKALKFDLHHLCPKATTKDKSDIIYNSIANIVPLNSEANRNEIKDRDIQDFYRDMKSIIGEEQVSYLFKQNLIPEKELQDIIEGNFDKTIFLEKRLSIITNYINSYFQSSER